MNTIRCGLIGLGRFGANHLRVLREMNGVALTAVADRDRASFETSKHLLGGVRTTTDADGIFSDPGIDAVLIVTPPSTHYGLIASGLASGKHVFVEKPMVVRFSDAEKLKFLVDERGKILMVGYQYLFNENIRFIKHEIDRGAFGRIVSLTSEHAVSSPRADVDSFTDAAPHPLSIYQFLFDPAALVSAEGAIEHDRASVRVQFSPRGGSGSDGERPDVPSLEINASFSGRRKQGERPFGEKRRPPFWMKRWSGINWPF